MEEWDNDNVVSCHGYNIQPLQRRVYRGPILRVGNFKVRLWNVVAALYPLPRCLFFLNVFFFGKEGGNPTTSRQICLSPSSVRFIAIHTTTPLSIFTFESTFAQFDGYGVAMTHTFITAGPKGVAAESIPCTRTHPRIPPYSSTSVATTTCWSMRCQAVATQSCSKVVRVTTL